MTSRSSASGTAASLIDEEISDIRSQTNTLDGKIGSLERVVAAQTELCMRVHLLQNLEPLLIVDWWVCRLWGISPKKQQS
jgi:hypothetical protein